MLDVLDEDTILLVLHHLSPVELATLSCTCCGFRDLLNERQSLWKSHCTDRWAVVAASLHPETGAPSELMEDFTGRT